MKFFASFLGLALSSTLCLGQFQAGYYQSGLPAVAVGYSIKGIVTPEFRLGTDLTLNTLAPELNVLVHYLRKEDYNLYLGLGVRPVSDFYPGIVIPVGMQIFPFEQKKCGFHFEASPVIGFESDNILRGSVGIRYRFLRQ